MYKIIMCTAVYFQQDTAGQERFHALGPIYYRDRYVVQHSKFSRGTVVH